MRVGTRTWLSLLSFTILLLPAQSRADFLTPVQTQVIPISQTDWSTPPPQPLKNIFPPTFDKFNSTTLTLTGAIITASVDYELTFDYSFISPSLTTLTDTANAFLGLNLPNNTAVISDAIFPTMSISRSGKLGDAPIHLTFSGHQTFGPIVLTSPADLAMFTGPGQIILPAGATAFSSFSSSSGNGFGAVQTKVGVTITLQFEFVPEPSSLALMGLGGGCLLLSCWFGRRFHTI